MALLFLEARAFRLLEARPRFESRSLPDYAKDRHPHDPDKD